jgi:hypothetical protein
LVFLRFPDGALVEKTAKEQRKDDTDETRGSKSADTEKPALLALLL